MSSLVLFAVFDYCFELFALMHVHKIFDLY